MTISSEYTIQLGSDADRDLAHVMFVKSRGTCASFEHHLGIKFSSFVDSQITFTATNEEMASKAKRAFAMLSGAMAGGRYINKGLIEEMAAQVNPMGSVKMTKKFRRAAANENIQQQTAITPKNDQQQLQIDLTNDQKNDIIFVMGPAGTGKTYLAVRMAVDALAKGHVSKLLFSRPAIEGAEKIGFLPGDFLMKMSPYMRPIFDELDAVFGPGEYKKMIELGTVEICPVGYMRGRTFKNCFAVLDEAQNCEYEHLKMAITRLGEGSRMIITGDPLQSDLPAGKSGLAAMVESVHDVEGVASMVYDAKNVVRHPTVKRIIDKLEVKMSNKQPVVAANTRPS